MTLRLCLIFTLFILLITCINYLTTTLNLAVAAERHNNVKDRFKDLEYMNVQKVDIQQIVLT